MTFETERAKYIEEVSERINKFRLKGPVEKVWFTEKDVLDYVLSYIGLGRAEYSNEPGQDAVYTGEVKIWLPDIDSARCGGHTKFCGDYNFSTEKAEEDAAGKALRFMESRLNIVIVDVNFNERLAAIEKHKSLIRMLGKLIDLCKDIRVQWTVMMECLTCGLDAYGLEFGIGV